MDEKLARAKGLNTYLKTLLSELNEYVSSEDGDCEQAKLMGLKSSVAGILEQLTRVHDEILSLIDPKDIEPEIINHMKALEPSHQVLARADLKLEKLKKGQGLSNANHTVGSASISTSGSSGHCRLPKLALPEFTGEPLEWQCFWDQYQVSIHNNSNISDIDKFNYLKGCVRGEALSAISGLTLTSENYQEAIQVLKDRFGNEQVLISAHMESLLKLSKIRSVDNIKELRKLYNYVENCVRNLKSLKLDTSGYGSLLIPILKDRLPDEINMIISRQFCRKVWNLDKVMEFFNNELRAQEDCCVSLSNKSENGKGKRDPYTASGLFSQTGKPPCLYCNEEGHFPSKCSKVSNHKSLKDILRKKGRCFICLDSRHIAKNCRANYVCKRCNKGKHHISICEAASSGREQRKESGGKESEEKGDGFVGHTGCDQQGILLQTARAQVYSVEDTSAEVSTRILFDSGSQRSYISEKVRARLQLKAIRSEKVIIKTFGQGSDSKVTRLDVVQFKVRDNSDSGFTLIEALCVPTICSPLTNQFISKARNLKEFKDLQFADHEGNSTNLPVGILIGVDYYHTFMTGKVVRSQAGPVACGTKLGWVISGSIGPNSPDLHCFETHILRVSVECRETSDSLRQDLDKFWAVETIGPPTDCVIDQFKNNIEHDGTRYITKLP